MVEEYLALLGEGCREDFSKDMISNLDESVLGPVLMFADFQSNACLTV